MHHSVVRKTGLNLSAVTSSVANFNVAKLEVKLVNLRRWNHQTWTWNGIRCYNANWLAYFTHQAGSSVLTLWLLPLFNLCNCSLDFLSVRLLLTESLKCFLIAPVFISQPESLEHCAELVHMNFQGGLEDSVWVWTVLRTVWSGVV